ncbi:MAG: type II secretion system F family protein [Candidatus Diapherotrites archaeon]
MELDEIKKGIEEQKKQKEKEKKQYEEYDYDAVEKIVKRMEKKYHEQGIQTEQASDKLNELRGMIAEQQRAEIELQGIDELRDYKNPFVRILGKTYSVFEFVLDPFSHGLSKMPVASQIRFYLYSANMRLSIRQYLALTVAGSFMGFIAGTIFFAIIFQFMNISLIYSLLGGLLIFMFTLTIMILFPRSMAMKRGDAISSELPFALRHMATELKSGIGLFKTIQAIAQSDYGVLSEEFARTINEIEEGTDTKDALQNFSVRTQSAALKNALLHVNRALKTGGNLSKVMNSIAEDVSFELRMKVRDFSEKINFFGVIYIVAGIVMPVMVAILGGIVNAPLGIKTFDMPPNVILLFYAVIMPALLFFLVFYLKMNQPKV